MTITYSLEVSQARVGGFVKLLFRWKGSIYRLLYKEMLIFILLYYSILVVYRFLLDSQQRRIFELLSWYMKDFTELVPITFVLGFYVALVVKRWWDQYQAIPWVDRLGMQIGAYVQGADEKGRLVRRGMVRYLNLMAVLTFRGISTTVMRRFPTMDHVEDAGLMTMEERVGLEETVAPHGNWWVPGQWFAQLAMAARKEGRIHDDLHLKSLIDEMLAFRGGCGDLWSHDWISIPLVYTQVVTIAVYSFFVACLFGRQYLFRIPAFDKRTSAYVPLGAGAAGNWTAPITLPKVPGVPFASEGGGADANQYVLDYYVPVFTLFQFFFYMGWLKVAEEMICPFGEDDDDFELNWIIDRNVQVGYAVVDTMYRRHPRLVRDAFWDESEPDVPYTSAAATYKTGPFLGSTVAMPLETRLLNWEKEEDGPLGSGPPTPTLRNRLRQTSINEEGESPPPRPRFLNGLIAGNSRLSLAHSNSKNSLMSSAQLPVRSPSLFSRQRSALSSQISNPFRKKKLSECGLPAAVYSAHPSRAGSRAGSMANMAAGEEEAAAALVAEEDLVPPTPPALLSGYINVAPSATTPTSASTTTPNGSATHPQSPADEGGSTEAASEGEETGGFAEKIAEAPVAAYDNPNAGGRLLHGVDIPPALQEEPEEPKLTPNQSQTLLAGPAPASSPPHTLQA